MTIRDLANNPIITGETAQVLGYIAPITTEEELPLLMYNFLLETIRNADSTREGALFVKRLFTGPQAAWETTQEKIFALKDLYSITKCPDVALKYLKNIVGWTSDLDYITDELDYDTLRKLIAASIPLWRERGREETTIDVLSLITGARCWIWNWFDYRWIVDETEFSEQHQGRDPWIIDSGEYESALRIVDDGTLNKVLVRNIMKLMRPCGERIEIAYIDFLENFLVKDDNTQWEALQGDEITVDNGYGELDASVEDQSSIVSVEYANEWARYVTYWRIRGSGEKFGVIFYYNNTDYYALRFNIGEQNVFLIKAYNGMEYVIGIYQLTYTIYADIWYGIRIHTENISDDEIEIRAYLDNELIIDYSDQGNGIMVAGTNPGGKIFRSIDFGLTWVEVEDTTESYIFSISVFPNGIILAGTAGNGKILRSADYGLTWAEVEDTAEDWILALCTFPNGIALAGTNPSGKIFRSIDYGLTWVEVEDTTETYIRTFSIFPDGVIIAGTATSGKILRSTDYGLTWTEVEDTDDATIRVSDTFPNGIGLVGTDSGKIYRSIDFGLTWAEAEDTGETNITSITTFPNGIVLVGTSDSGKVFRSIDYGVNWAEVEDTTETHILSLTAFPNGVVLAGTNPNGKILRSIDYGLTWAEVEDTGQTQVLVIENFTKSLTKGAIGFFAKESSTIKLSDCESFQLPLETALVDINS